MISERLKYQLGFLVEIDKLKGIVRRTHLIGTDRLENSAEHSWHVAVMALFLSEYAEESLDQLRIIKMLLIHDLVEIDAGDTFFYDEEARQDKAIREKAAASRLFGLLPEDQGMELKLLWEEFEAQETSESRFAEAMDRLMPILHNYYTPGRGWKEHGITKNQVVAHNRHMQAGSEALWHYAKSLIEESVQKGYLAP